VALARFVEGEGPWRSGRLPVGCGVRLARIAEEQGRRSFTREDRAGGPFQELEYGTALLGTGCDRRPDAFRPLSAGNAAGALRHMPVQHHEPNRLLRQIVGRLDAGRSDESQVTLAVCVEPVGQILGFARPRHAMRGFCPDFVPGVFELPGKSARRQLVAAMNQAEHRPQLVEHPAAVGPVAGVGMLDQEFHVADQMSQAKLHEDVLIEPHVLAVGAEVVAAQNTVELRAQHIQQHVAATRRRDLEQREQRRPETPGPQRLPPLFVPGLVDVQPRLSRQVGQEFVVGRRESPLHFAAQVAEVTAADRHAHHVAEELAHGAERAVTGPFQIGDQRREPRPDQTRADHLARQPSDVRREAPPAPAYQGTMFRDLDRRADDLDLLKDAGNFVGRRQRAAAVGADVQRMFASLIDLVIGKGLPLVPGMPRLAARLAPFLSPALGFPLARRLHDVARRTFRRVGGILSGPGQLAFERRCLVLQRRQPRCQRAVFPGQGRTFRTSSRRTIVHDVRQSTRQRLKSRRSVQIP